MANSYARAVLVAVAVSLIGFANGTSAQEGEPQVKPLDWQRGPGTAPIGTDIAEIDLSENFVFLDEAETRRLMELTENPLSGAEMATVAPMAEDEGWFIIFEWDAVGYVSDEEKDELDAEAILESVRQGTEAANEERRKRGWETMHIVGWYEEPHYDEKTNNLTWAIVAESGGHKTINRITKLLGRRGIMTATLVASPEELDKAAPATDMVMADYRFRPGSTYAEFIPGTDKLAEYGLTALVVGGAGAALLKSGLLAKIWKPLLAGLVAVGAFVKRIFFSGRKVNLDQDKPIG